MKKFLQEALSVFRDRKGEQRAIYGASVYSLFFAVKGPLRMFASTLFKDLMQQVCFILPQSIFVMIYEKKKGGQG